VPVVETLTPPVVDVPSYEPPVIDPPSYDPPTVVPAPDLGNNSESEEGEEGPGTDGLDLPNLPAPAKPQRPQIEVPVVGEVPLPYMGEVMLAGTTAIGATIATLVGKSMVEQLLKIFKPTFKKIALKIKDAVGKRFNDYELQAYFEFEGQKALSKHLAKEQKQQKAKQLEAHQQRRRQRKR